MEDTKYPFTWQDVGERQGGDVNNPYPPYSQAEKEAVAATWNANWEADRANDWIRNRVEGKTISHRDAQNRRIIDSVETGYPPMTDQLDIIYWDKVNGTTIWKDTIDAIKAKFPKPT
tara:strand:+ start:1489 stop:1839 length:351 start_codon:yes stop_codon:yes gene_type:complete